MTNRDRALKIWQDTQFSSNPQDYIDAITAALGEKDRLRDRAVKAEADDWRSKYEPLDDEEDDDDT